MDDNQERNQPPTSQNNFYGPTTINGQTNVIGGTPRIKQGFSGRNQPLYYVGFVVVAVIVLIGADVIYMFHPQNLGSATSTHFNMKQPTPTHSHIAVPTDTPSNVGSLNIAWSLQRSVVGSGQTIGSVAWSGSLFVAVGDQNGKGIILTSPDKSHWTVQNNQIEQMLHSIVWSSSRSLFVAVGDAGLILTSRNGKTWNPPQHVGSNNLYNIAWSGSLFVAVGDAGTIITSLDGEKWNSQDSPSNSEPLYGNGGGSGPSFVAVGGVYNSTAGIILTSSHGTTWPSQSYQYELNNVAWSGSQFVVVGGYSSTWVILTSSDGSAWTTQSFGTGYRLIDIVWSGKFFVAVGSNGTITASYDGRTWTSPQTLPSSVLDKNLYGVTWTGTFFVAVGADGTVLTSS